MPYGISKAKLILRFWVRRDRKSNESSGPNGQAKPCSWNSSIHSILVSTYQASSRSSSSDLPRRSMPSCKRWGGPVASQRVVRGHSLLPIFSTMHKTALDFQRVWLSSSKAVVASSNASGPTLWANIPQSWILGVQSVATDVIKWRLHSLSIFTFVWFTELDYFSRCSKILCFHSLIVHMFLIYAGDNASNILSLKHKCKVEIFQLWTGVRVHPGLTGLRLRDRKGHSTLAGPWS